MPTLMDLLDLCMQAPEMMLNIELKGPCDPLIKPKYDSDKAARVVYDLIIKYDIADRVMISSF